MWKSSPSAARDITWNGKAGPRIKSAKKSVRKDATPQRYFCKMPALAPTAPRGAAGQGLWQDDLKAFKSSCHNHLAYSYSLFGAKLSAPVRLTCRLFSQIILLYEIVLPYIETGIGAVTACVRRVTRSNRLKENPCSQKIIRLPGSKTST